VEGPREGNQSDSKKKGRGKSISKRGRMEGRISSPGEKRRTKTRNLIRTTEGGDVVEKG